MSALLALAALAGVGLVRTIPFRGPAADLYANEYDTEFLAEAGAVARFDLREDHVLWEKELGGTVPGIALAPDGRTFTYCSNATFLGLYDLDTAAKVADLEDPLNNPDHVSAGCTIAAFSRDGRFVVTAERNSDGWVSLWDVEAHRAVQFYKDEPHGILQVGTALHDRWVYALGRSGLQVWNLETGAAVARVTAQQLLPFAAKPPPGESLPQRQVGLKAMAFGPELRFAALSMGWSAHVVDLESGEIVRTVALDAGSMIRRLAITKDGTRLLAYGVEITNGHESPGTLAAWDLTSGAKLWEFTDARLGALYRYRPDAAAAFVGDGRYFVSGEIATNADSGIKVWRLP